MCIKEKEKLNIIRISDGLGNQMFQYAFGYGMYRKTGRGMVVDPMYSGQLRHYQLECFKIDFSKRFVGKRTDNVLGLGSRNSAPFRLKYREYKTKCERLEVVKEASPMKYDESIYLSSAAYYVGFWQSYRYFDEYYDDIKRQFQPKYSLSLQGKNYLKSIESELQNGMETVSLHVRRTDYNRIKNNVCLGIQFYKQALECMRNKIGEFSLYIFTDDKEFVKENFHFIDYVLIEGISDLEEFALMQKCRNHIIANSTYSWWGAYLADDKGGCVYAPLTDMWTGQFYLPQWNKIETQVGYSNW